MIKYFSKSCLFCNVRCVCLSTPSVSLNRHWWRSGSGPWIQLLRKEDGSNSYCAVMFFICSLYVYMFLSIKQDFSQLAWSTTWQLHLKVRTRWLELVFQPRFTYLLCSRCALAANHWFCFLIKFLFTQRVHDLWTQLSSLKAPAICIKSHFCIGWQDNLMFFFFLSCGALKMQSLQPCLTEGCDADHRSELWSPWPLSEWSTCRKRTLTQGNLNQQRNKNKQGLFIVCLVFSFSNFWCSATLRHGRECVVLKPAERRKTSDEPKLLPLLKVSHKQQNKILSSIHKQFILEKYLPI